MARALELGSGDDEPKLKSSVQEARYHPRRLSWETLVGWACSRWSLWRVLIACVKCFPPGGQAAAWVGSPNDGRVTFVMIRSEVGRARSLFASRMTFRDLGL